MTAPSGTVHESARESARESGVRPPAGIGPAVALTVMAAWGISLVALLAVPLARIPVIAVVALVILRTWLHTGLFITAHDAMHGGPWPGRPRWNNALGATAVGLYALFPYPALRREHLRHHAAPATPGDPDHHDGAHPGFVRWYVRFVRHYVRPGQIVGMAVVFNVLQHLAGVPQGRLLAFWVLPALLSTVQLFTFGTYLPHRDVPGGHADGHRARSTALPPSLSLLTCFHFGYHWEHHARPGVPWWALPAVHGARRTVRATVS